MSASLFIFFKMEDSNNIKVDSSTNNVCEQLGNIGIDNASEDHDSDYDEE